MEETVIYTRVSSKKQLAEGHGNESQEQSGKRLIEMNGWVLLRSFNEPGITGATTKRPAMQEMIAFLRSRHKQGKKTVVIIDDLKRFSRDIGGYLELKELVTSCGAKLASPKFNFEDSPEGEFFELLTVLTGQLERKQNRRQVVDRMKSRLEMGYWCFPATPPGLQLVKEAGHGKIMRRKEPEASIYTEALEGYASGRLKNQAAVSAFLSRKLGRPLTVQAARNTLDRALIYAGYVEYPKWEVTKRKGKHDALISLETYLKIQERLNGSTRKHTRRDMNPDFPLRGRVVCAECQEKFRAAWCAGRSSRYPKYWCANRECPFYSATIKRDAIEGSFEVLLKEIKPEARTLEATKRRMLRRWQTRFDDVVEYHASLVKEAESITKQVNELVDRVGTASRTVAAAYERRIDELELQRVALEEKQGEHHPDNFDYRTALEEVVDFIKNPYKRWNSGILAEQQRVLDICFVRDVEYHQKTGYQTAHLSPTFGVLTNNIAVSEESSESRFSKSGRGGN